MQQLPTEERGVEPKLKKNWDKKRNKLKKNKGKGGEMNK